MHYDDKIESLKNNLIKYQRVAVAFSGGSDSSFLLKCALDALGAGNVLILFGKSELLKSKEIERVERWLENNGYPTGIEIEILQLQPLSWKEFIINASDRCYRCKFRIYQLFFERMQMCGFSTLVDGTNIDDLKSDRAGLRALRELGVRTPLVDAGFDKTDVRNCSCYLELFSWNQPSSSCLATRIPTGMTITKERLAQIDRWEEEVENLGFQGCRVRMVPENNNAVYLEIESSDFSLLLNMNLRKALIRYFQNCGMRDVFLNLAGR